jgi:hypothetical protein
MYEKLKIIAAIHLSTTATNLDISSIILASSISSAIASLASNPFDVIKTQYQLQKSNGAGLKDIIYTEKFKVLYIGALARMIWAVPNTVISFTFFEYMKSF